MVEKIILKQGGKVCYLSKIVGEDNLTLALKY